MSEGKSDSPYKGLVPFEDTEVDALLFFGRGRESEIIGANVLAARLTVLYGPSGVGKSSVLRAGVARQLRRLAQTNIDESGHPELAVVVFDAWSDDPVAGIRAAARDELSKQFGSAMLDEREGESLADTLERWTTALACDVLLILDQAEEYFLYHAEEAGFARELPELVTRPGLRVRVLLALRDDALAKLDRFKGRIPNLFANYLRLDHLDRRSAREAVVKPLERFNAVAGESMEIEPALVELVLDETAAGKVAIGDTGRGLAVGEKGGGRIEAPYLQLVMERIWDEERSADSTVLRAATLHRLGGAESIVRAHLRRAVEELSPDEKDVAADVFRFLVTPSGAKIAHGISDLADYADVDERRLLPVLSTLGRERIVRPVDGAGANGARYEIFHDVLGEAVLAWRRDQELEREKRKAAKRQRRLVALSSGALLALAAMTAVAIYAFSQREAAKDQRRDSQARALLAQSLNQLDIDPELSLLLGLRAAAIERNRQVEDVLRRALEASRIRGVHETTLTNPVPPPRNGRARVLGRVLPHRNALALALSPDRRLAATGGRDRTARLWSARTGKLRHVLRGHGLSVLAVAFSPDGKLLATGSADGTARLWTTSDGELVDVLVAHTNPVTSVAFNQRGDLVATGSRDRTVRVWGTGDGRHLLTLRGHGDSVNWVGFKGPLLATFSADGTERLWDPEPEPRLRVIRRARAPEPGPRVAVVPGKRAVANGKSVVLEDLETGKKLFLRGHSNSILSVHFDREGTRLVTASVDKDARIWDVETGKSLHVLRGHFGPVSDADFSPDGRWVVTAGPISGGLWRSDANRPYTYLRGHTARWTDARFIGERQIETAGEDNTVRTWNCEICGTLDELVELAERRLALTERALSPDERGQFLSD